MRDGAPHATIIAQSRRIQNASFASLARLYFCVLWQHYFENNALSTYCLTFNVENGIIQNGIIQNNDDINKEKINNILIDENNDDNDDNDNVDNDKIDINNDVND